MPLLGLLSPLSLIQSFIISPTHGSKSLAGISISFSCPNPGSIPQASSSLYRKVLLEPFSSSAHKPFMSPSSNHVLRAIGQDSTLRDSHSPAGGSPRCFPAPFMTCYLSPCPLLSPFQCIFREGSQSLIQNSEIRKVMKTESFIF